MTGELIPTGYTYDQGRIAINNSFSAQTFQTLTDTATISWDYSLGANAVVTLGGNRALSITNISDGDYGTIIIIQDGAGNRTLSLPATSKVINGGGGSILLTSTASAQDILSFVYKASTFYWTAGYDYS